MLHYEPYHSHMKYWSWIWIYPSTSWGRSLLHTVVRLRRAVIKDFKNNSSTNIALAKKILSGWIHVWWCHRHAHTCSQIHNGYSNYKGLCWWWQVQLAKIHRHCCLVFQHATCFLWLCCTFLHPKSDFQQSDSNLEPGKWWNCKVQKSENWNSPEGKMTLLDFLT